MEYFAYNAVGHTVALTDDAGAVGKTDLYGAFGDIVGTYGDSENNRLANTKERSAALGLDNHGFRLYDPEIARYLTRDPLGYVDGLNPYLYVANNPINLIDPLGLEISAETAIGRSVVDAYQAIVGNSAVLSLERKRVIERTRERLITDDSLWGKFLQKLYGTPKGKLQKVLERHEVQSISYKETPEGKATVAQRECWQTLKKALDKQDVEVAVLDSKCVDNSRGDTAGDIRFVDINPAVAPVVVLEKPDGTRYQTTGDFPSTLWHESIGHSNNGVEHSTNAEEKKNDPVHQEENRARKALSLDLRVVDRNVERWPPPGSSANSEDRQQ